LRSLGAEFARRSTECTRSRFEHGFVGQVFVHHMRGPQLSPTPQYSETRSGPSFSVAIAVDEPKIRLHGKDIRGGLVPSTDSGLRSPGRAGLPGGGGISCDVSPALRRFLN